MLTAWIVAGAVMILLELFLPGMVLGFLGSSALIVAALIWLGWIDGLIPALTTWFILSLVLLLSLRGLFLRFVGGGSERQSTDEEEDAYGTVVDVVERIAPDQAGRIRVHRYEIKNLSPPPTVKDAMEKQVTAERDRRAVVAQSEGDKQSRINTSEGRRLELINRSEGEMQRTINEAQGQAEEVRAIAHATAESIEKIAASISVAGGAQSVHLQLAERYLKTLRGLADGKTDVLLPVDLANPQQLLDTIELRGPDG